MNKAEKIKAEIERLKNELSYNKEILNLREIIAVNNCYNNLILFIDSLSDTEKDFGIKESVIPFGASDSELMEETIYIPEGFHAVIEGDKVIMKKGEKSVSEDLEEAAEEYAPDFSNSIASKVAVDAVRDAFKAGAQWQKEQMMKNSDFINEAEWEDDIHKLFREKGKKVKLMIVEEE